MFVDVVEVYSCLKLVLVWPGGRLCFEKGNHGHDHTDEVRQNLSHSPLNSRFSQPHPAQSSLIGVPAAFVCGSLLPSQIEPQDRDTNSLVHKLLLSLVAGFQAPVWEPRNVTVITSVGWAVPANLTVGGHSPPYGMASQFSDGC